MRFTRKLAVAAVAATAFAVGAGTAIAAIGVSTAPGVNAPPTTLANYQMTPFGADPQPLGPVTSVALPVVTTGHPLSRPTGSILFSQSVTHATVPGGGWNNWSHGYTGDVYHNTFVPPSVDQNNITITMPPKVGAFYLYTEYDLFTTAIITAVGRDGNGHSVTTSVSVTSPGGASYIGFYNTTFGAVTSITVSKSPLVPLGLAVGEFGVSNQLLTKIT